MMAICQLHSMHLQKEVKSNPKQPSYKKSLSCKVCGPQEGHCEKSKVAAKNSLDGRLMAKILITTIQVNLVPNPSET